MAMASDPFDPRTGSLDKVAAVRAEHPSAPAHLPPMALIIPTFFGPVAIERPADEGEEGES